MFFIAQIQVAQQYSSLTAQNNSATGTWRHRYHVCVYENWIQCPTSKQSLMTLRCSGPFWPRGKCCKEVKKIHVKTRSSARRSLIHPGSPTTVSCNTLWFLMKHQDETNDTAVILRSPRSDFRMLPHIICRFSDDCWIQPQRRSHSFAVYSPDTQ